MKATVFNAMLLLILSACTAPLGGDAYMNPPDMQVNKTTARVGESVEVTVVGGFRTKDTYYKEEFVESGVSLGACFSYSSDMDTEGGLCSGNKQPLPEGLRLTSDANFEKDFGDVVVKRGEEQKIEYTFTFTSDKSGTVVLVPIYKFGYGPDIDPSIENGPLNTIRVTFE